MKRHFVACGLLLAAVAVSAYGDDKHEHLPAAPKRWRNRAG